MRISKFSIRCFFPQNLLVASIAAIFLAGCSTTHPAPTHTEKPVWIPTVTITLPATITISTAKVTPTAKITVPAAAFTLTEKPVQAPDITHLAPTLTPTPVQIQPIRGLIAFADWMERGIALTRLDGIQAQVIALTPKRLIYTPAWSPDGRWIAFSSRQTFENDDQIFLVRADGSELHQVTGGYPRVGRFPAWSPDGKQIIYEEDQTSTIENRTVLVVINADGSGYHQLTNRISNARLPTWTPDGKKISFLYLRYPDNPENTGGYYLYTMDPDGSNWNKIDTGGFTIVGGVFGRSYSWSPDGNQIAFVSDDDCDLYKMDLRTSAIQRLTPESLNLSFTDPSWSPDGRQILFNALWEGASCHGGSGMGQKTFLINADGSGLIQLSIEPEGGLANPAWSPVPSLQAGGAYTITAWGNDLNLRTEPSLQGKTLKNLKEGDQVAVLDGPREADGYYWWKLRTADGTEGWAVDVSGWYRRIDGSQ